ncbi:hypothetical protein M878_42900 [Streptomyces roseochromogenus subsp. oscitans DS 12.976]|uniref:Uncharacterized protein n=1 Tax=Streptomyces roseochromogenus subsp. oscitans DS 12.976 TaxID=1352936 RepID=V6JGI2_STRRC|nr:hypothetical protein M878_42900 [Streptomyces roseochromogenus subsp. oscitans DS 12.976]
MYDFQDGTDTWPARLPLCTSTVYLDGDRTVAEDRTALERHEAIAPDAGSRGVPAALRS